MPPVARRRAMLAALVWAAAGAGGCVGDPKGAAVHMEVAAREEPVSIDELVAPIALYPDQLLAQVLAIATTPQAVLDAGNWLLQNESLRNDALVQATRAAGFARSAQYLALFPQVVDNMCQELAWTTRLGEAFAADQWRVLDAVQRKRQQAQRVGNLQTGPQMTVSRREENGTWFIELAPAHPTVVYVPEFNPVDVYVTKAVTNAGTSPLTFGVGMAVGAAIAHASGYYPSAAWGLGTVLTDGTPFRPLPYQPPVYPGYRPADGYHPPPDYRWSRYNRTTNRINDNYYDRFSVARYGRADAGASVKRRL